MGRLRTLITPPDPDWSLRTRLAKMVTTGPAVLILGLLLGAAGILPRLAANAASNTPAAPTSTPRREGGPIPGAQGVLVRLLADEAPYRDMSVWGTTSADDPGVLLMRRRSMIPFFRAMAIALPAIVMKVPILTDLLYLRHATRTCRASARTAAVACPFFPAMLAGARSTSCLPGDRPRPRLVAILPLGAVAAVAWYVRDREGVSIGAGAGLARSGRRAVLAARRSARLAPPRDGASPTPGPRSSSRWPCCCRMLSTSPGHSPNHAKTRGAGHVANDSWMQGLIAKSLAKHDLGGVASS